jgi:hypothetical protein
MGLRSSLHENQSDKAKVKFKVKDTEENAVYACRTDGLPGDTLKEHLRESDVSYTAKIKEEDGTEYTESDKVKGTLFVPFLGQPSESTDESGEGVKPKSKRGKKGAVPTGLEPRVNPPVPANGEVPAK